MRYRKLVTPFVRALSPKFSRGNRQLLAVKRPVFAERRRRSRFVLRENSHARKSRLKAKYHVREREEMGTFKKLRNSPKFEHIAALEQI